MFEPRNEQFLEAISATLRPKAEDSFCFGLYKHEQVSIFRERRLPAVGAITLADVYWLRLGDLAKDIAPFDGSRECRFSSAFHVDPLVPVSTGPPLQILYHLHVLA